MMTLEQYLKEASQTQREFARAIGVSASYMNEIVKGGKSPSLSIAARIEAQTKGQVPMAALLKDAIDESHDPNTERGAA